MLYKEGSVLRLFLLFSALAGQTIFAADVRDVTYQGDLGPLNIEPTFDKGYLLVYEYGPGVAVYGPDGSLKFHAVVNVPGVEHVVIVNAAADVDGTLVAAVEYTQKDHRGGLALFDPDGGKKEFFDTGEYRPTQVDFGPDHTVWTIGWIGATTESDPPDYSVLRNYSRTGKLLGDFLPRSTFDREHDPVGPVIGGWQLRVTSKRVGAVFYASSVRKSGETRRDAIQWVELDLKGNIIGRWNPPPKHICAFTDDGDVYAKDPGGISVLDRTSGTWRHVPGVSTRLIGADGDSLVYMISNDTLRHAQVSP
jgi:hypothetical protein